MTELLIWAREPKYLPTKAHARDAGYDLKACIDSDRATLENEIKEYWRSSLPCDNFCNLIINGKKNSFNAVTANGSSLVERIEQQCLFNCDRTIALLPYQTKVVSAGFKVRLPRAKEGYVTALQIYPRSGLGIKSGLILANSVGIVDENYINDEVKIGLYNNSSHLQLISDNTRVAQALIIEVLDLNIIAADKWDVSGDRGGGLGSSGA